jgi:hypothetical protein
MQNVAGLVNGLKNVKKEVLQLQQIRTASPANDRFIEVMRVRSVFDSEAILLRVLKVFHF